MPDRSSTPALDDGVLPEDDHGWEDELDGTPPRARRTLVKPVTVALCGLVIAIGGFIAGVQVQKGNQDTGGGTGDGVRAAFAAGPGGPPGVAAAGDRTIGSVANKKGSTLYVTDTDGTTVKVKTNAQSKVTRNAAASAKGIFPGDTVIVQGIKDKDGSLVATQITATSKTAAASGGGFGGGFGGRARGAAASGG